jgi:hypothetical protein
MQELYINSAHPVGRGELQGCSRPLNQNKKKMFLRQDDVKRFTLYTLQPKSAIDICEMTSILEFLKIG